MNEEEWVNCHDVQRLYEYLPQPASDRRMRLWTVACARLVTSPRQLNLRYEQFRAWLASPAWEVSLAAAERFADGELNRKGLRAARKMDGGGGPYNVFLIAAGGKHFTHRAAMVSLRACSHEFGTPTAEEQSAYFRDIFGNLFPSCHLLF